MLSAPVLAILASMVTTVRQYAFAFIFAITGIVIVSTSIYSIKFAHEVADVHAPLVDAAMEVKLELALANIDFEEHISGEEASSIDAVHTHIEQAKWYARAMISGGKNSEGVYIPIENEALRDKVLRNLEGITQLEESFDRRYADIGLARQGGEVDRKFEQLFHAVLGEADAVENELLAALVEKRNVQRLINYSTLTISISLFLLVLYYFISLRRKELDLMNRLNDMVVSDALTGVANRRSFDACISNEWNHALRARSSLCLVICDIDYFKEYNDKLGHQAGDECLIAVAKVLQSILQRPVDYIARYGGDEFAYILPFTDVKGGVGLMEILHNTLSRKKISHPDSAISGHVTLSIGIASVTPTPDHSIIELISEADRALYRAKEEGRNRTCYKEIE
ncbi:MAG TPA: diguanylate cyclase [Mariprofundaceae bacterium]|nr:diguanylate cyclase [Mariprofundaceae bacterium]